MKYEDVLAHLAEVDPRVVVMTAENRAAIRGLPARLGPRFIDVGIAEQTMIGAAAGLALRGRRPITHALASFLVFRAYEFIRDDIALPNLPVKLVGGVPGFLSDGNGPTHQAIEDVALMRTLPNMQVFCPSDETELVAGMRVLMETDAPCYIRYYAGPAPVVHTAPFEVGRAEVLSEGTDVALVTYGFLLAEAVEAKERLEATGVSVRLVNLRMPRPVDERVLLAAAAETRLVVTLEDHLETGGLYSILAETLLREGRSARVLPIALADRWFKPALLPDVLRFEGFDGASIAEKVRVGLG